MMCLIMWHQTLDFQSSFTYVLFISLSEFTFLFFFVGGGAMIIDLFSHRVILENGVLDLLV